MDAISFKCQLSNDGPFVLKKYPRFPSRFEERRSTVLIGLQAVNRGLVNDVVTLRIESLTLRSLEVTHIPLQMFNILSKLLKSTGKANMFKCESPDVVFGKTKRHVALLKIKGFVRTPLYVLVTDNSSNFYAAYAIQKTLRKLKQAKQEFRNISFADLFKIAERELPIRETFETQFMNSAVMRTVNSNPQENNQDDMIYSISTSDAVDMIDGEQRIDEYQRFIEKESQQNYPTSNDGSLEFVKGKLVRNKETVDAMKDVSAKIEELNFSLQRFSKYFPENLVNSLKCLSKDIDSVTSEYRCCQCMEEWRDCMLVNCFHMVVCKSCIVKNRKQYNRFSCPICKSQCSFIFTDADL